MPTGTLAEPRQGHEQGRATLLWRKLWKEQVRKELGEALIQNKQTNKQKTPDNLRVPINYDGFISRTQLITSLTQDPAPLTVKSILSAPERSLVVPKSRPPDSPSD